MTRGRSQYTTAIADRIVAELMSGRSLGSICRDPGMPPENTVYQWVRDDREGFAARFRQCRKVAGPKGGGPTVYTAEIAERILGELMAGRTLAAICRDPGMPRPGTVRNWASEDRDGFAARYCEARDIGYDEMIDELREIGRDASLDINLARLRSTNLRWLLSKTLPRDYGDRPNLLQQLKARDMKK
jgi:transposase-like protein